jgi:cell volume regulation protein A
VELGLAVDEIVLAVGALLTLGVLGAGIASHFQLPGIVVSPGFGMALGSDGLDWIDIGAGELDWVQSLSVMALVLILFDGGLSTSTRAGAGPRPPAGTSR